MDAMPVDLARRLAGYEQALADLASAGARSVSSRELARRAGVSPAALRADLARFGRFGKGGPGYDIGYLRTRIRETLAPRSR
ncbi:MAG: winged-helix domain-containing protein [Candidatus Eiseniibacteriota bacterium]|jgi:redox-sensing transcriptional repressor